MGSVGDGSMRGARPRSAGAGLDDRLEQFLPLLEQIDTLRQALHNRTADLFDKVNNGPPDVRASYHRFLQLGGSTGADLRHYLGGQPLHRYQDGASKGYGRLRLVCARPCCRTDRD
jgi:hypothetical protein